MDEHNEQMKSVRHFWAKHKEECCLIRSIDAVFDIYVNYHKNYENPADGKYKFQPLNRYKFRAFIRKNGYNNSGEVMITPSQKKEIKDEQKLERTAKQLEKLESLEQLEDLDKKEIKKKQKLLKVHAKLEKKATEKNQNNKEDNTVSLTNNENNTLTESLSAPLIKSE